MGRSGDRGQPARLAEVRSEQVKALGKVLGHDLRFADDRHEVRISIPARNEVPMEVAVDTETGEISVLKCIGAHDVGQAINPDAVEG